MSRNTIESLNKDNCTGCGACYNACPTQAIGMKINNEGFCEPFIDFNKCVYCGRCEKICPQMGDKVKYEFAKHAYGIRCNDKIREKCSSGGVFGAIAEWAISNAGCVFGASFSKDFTKVIHIKAKDNSVKKLFKSKYLQSDTGLIFQDVRQELETSNALVVFSACPCQVAGLKTYLGKDYSNLITIDILCHGVVSPRAYQIFLREFFGDVDSPIKDVDFRPKEMGWGCSNVAVTAEDGTKRISPYKGDYFNAFLWGYSQRKVCFDCKYARCERVGDITIGDFWGINNILPKLNDGKGISLVLCNTNKGNDVINKINKYIDKIEECDYKTMLDAVKDVNWALYKPGIAPKNRDVFFYRLSKGDTFSQAFRYASSPKYDVGIFGWWFEDQWTNYGSTLTYYALMEYVSSLGLSVCMITSPFHNRENASEFVKKHGYVMSQTYPFDKFYKHNENIGTFLIGSDQLWFYHCYKPWGHSLFLDFVDDNKKKIAYATSFGHSDPKIPNEELPKLKNLLKRFQAISNREFEGVKIMSEKFGLNSTQTVDPVFLCDMSNWLSIAEDAERKTEGDFIFAYILDPNDEKIKALEHVSKSLGLKVVSITDKQYDNDNKVKQLNKFGILKHATIPEQIYHLMKAKYVVTDSYHGTCFSVLFRRNFVAIINAQRGISRFETIAKLFDIEDRFVYSANEILKHNDIFEFPDYSKIEPRLKRAVQRSKAWLNYQLLNN